MFEAIAHDKYRKEHEAAKLEDLREAWGEEIVTGGAEIMVGVPEEIRADLAVEMTGSKRRASLPYRIGERWGDMRLTKDARGFWLAIHHGGEDGANPIEGEYDIETDKMVIA